MWSLHTLSKSWDSLSKLWSFSVPKKNWNGRLSIPKKYFPFQKNTFRSKKKLERKSFKAYRGLVRRKSDSTRRTVRVSTVPEQLWTSSKMREINILKEIFDTYLVNKTSGEPTKIGHFQSSESIFEVKYQLNLPENDFFNFSHFWKILFSKNVPNFWWFAITFFTRYQNFLWGCWFFLQNCP